MQLMRHPLTKVCTFERPDHFIIFTQNFSNRPHDYVSMHEHAMYILRVLRSEDPARGKCAGSAWRRAAISLPPNLEHTSAMCDPHKQDSSKTSERSEGNTAVCNKTKRNRSDQNGKPEGQSRSKFRIGNSGAAALSESGTRIKEIAQSRLREIAGHSRKREIPGTTKKILKNFR